MFSSNRSLRQTQWGAGKFAPCYWRAMPIVSSRDKCWRVRYEGSMGRIRKFASGGSRGKGNILKSLLCTSNYSRIFPAVWCALLKHVRECTWSSRINITYIVIHNDWVYQESAAKPFTRPQHSPASFLST